MGDALYEQKNYEEASKAFSGVTERNTSNEIVAFVFNNSDDFKKLKIARQSTAFLDKYLSDPYMASFQ